MSPFLQFMAAKLFQKHANYNLFVLIGWLIVTVMKLEVSIITESVCFVIALVNLTVKVIGPISLSYNKI